MKPKLVRLFLAEDIPDGLRTVELSNTTVLGTIFPRSSINSFASRKAAEKPAVYLLIGVDQKDTTVKRVYVGEGDPVLPRLKNHIVNKDFWTQAIVFTSKDDYLTKTQIQFLEASVIEKLKSAARAILDNGSIPTLPNISEAEKSEVEHFLEVMSLLLASIGLDILELRSATAPVSIKEKNVFSFSVKNAKGKMVISVQGYVVLKGSTATRKGRPSASSRISKMRKSLIDAGILLIQNNDLYVFNDNVPFDSPSIAAAMIAGGNMNGRTKWKLPNGKNLKDVEEKAAIE